MDKKEKEKAHIQNIINTTNGIVKVLTDDNLTDFGKRFCASLVADMGYHNALMISSQMQLPQQDIGERVIPINGPETVLNKQQQENIKRITGIAYIK